VEPVGDHGGGKVMRAGDDVAMISVSGIGDGGFEDADDGGRAIAHGPLPSRTVLPRTPGSFIESSSRTIGENGDAGSFGPRPEGRRDDEDGWSP